jgi:acyl-CoA synthetase (AMP-forming)/AMP-acid ligase II
LSKAGAAEAGDILEATRKLLASYKLPKDLLVVPVVPRAPEWQGRLQNCKVDDDRRLAHQVIKRARMLRSSTASSALATQH